MYQAAEQIANELRREKKLACYIADVGLCCIDFTHLDLHAESAFADGMETFVHEWLHHLGWTDRRIDRWTAPKRGLMQEFVRSLQP